ncbi:hypothetical protein DF047_04485 [Burkholderia cenocepacia]|uniref:MltR family transcriptional regulator n=1 Tax=Burkholderia cepacia complex TaxID=87882 RepID=UPI000F5BA7BD|nr:MULTISPECIES: MltR family transcriptional regulator [Burkholderia cepacia complex]MDN7848461.1 MltR family transcriptional regulator [Burkholderia seminalis]RQV12253.1 hypothetical protein DF047_04485 [Burkholderia cenocepacia]
MALPENIDFRQINDLIGAFNKESDRGAAILAGSFLEHYLGVFLQSKTVDEKVAEKLFGAMGPLATFSQRIAVAYAFGFIDKELYRNIELIRKIRNYFAHHPFEGTFESEEVKGKVLSLSTYGGSQSNYSAAHARQVYVFACGVICGHLWKLMHGSAAKSDEASAGGTQSDRNS